MIRVMRFMMVIVISRKPATAITTAMVTLSGMLKPLGYRSTATH